MTTFTLPEGYSFEPEGAAVLSDIPHMQEYGGATITEAWDASGAHFVACCAKNPQGVFGFRLFREDAPEVWREIPLQPFCDGRGSITKNDYDGTLRWTAWRGAQFFGGVVPEAVAFASHLAPEAAVELWRPDYASDAELTGPPGLAVRVSKLKRAVIQVQDVLKARGWLQ